MARKGEAGMGVWTGSAGRVTSRVGVDRVSPAIRSLTTFAAPDYVDLYSLDTPRAKCFSPEEWARAALERAPVSRRGARSLWRTMGLRLGPAGDARYVQGWHIAAGDGSYLRLETSSWYLEAEAVCVVDGDTVALSLSLRFARQPVASVVWAAIAGPHQRAVPVMLSQADELLAHDIATG
jgi:hypothetical protein